MSVLLFSVLMAAMSKLTKSICWKLVVVGKDQLNGVGAAIFQKPTSNKCYKKRPQNEPPLCEESDDSNAAWYIHLSSINVCTFISSGLNSMHNAEFHKLIEC